MFNGEFAFITVDFFVEQKWEDESWFKDLNGNPFKIGDVYNAFLDLSAEKPDLENKHKNFSMEVRRRMAMPPFNHAMLANEKVCCYFSLACRRKRPILRFQTGSFSLRQAQ